MNGRRAEQRGSPRLSVNCEIGCRSVDGQRQRFALVKNISGNGVLIVADEPPVPGARMEIVVGGGLCSIPALHAFVEVVRVTARPSWDFGAEAPATSCYDIGARIVSMH